MKYFLAKYLVWLILGSMLVLGVTSLVRMKDDVQLTLSFPTEKAELTTYTLLQPNTLIRPSLSESGVLINEPTSLIPEVDATISLTEESILARTNSERIEKGVMPVTKSAILTKSATIKAQDILARQYFAHESPDSKVVSDLVTSAGYTYVSVGENLALGTFKNSEDLIHAWMNSQGHKENILSSRYTELGIGIVRGSYKGDIVWVIVQHFGKPLSACDSPDELFRQTIEGQAQALEVLYDTIQQEQKAIKSHRSPLEYEAAIEQVNNNIDSYNETSKQLAQAIEKYNKDVQSFNACIEGK